MGVFIVPAFHLFDCFSGLLVVARWWLEAGVPRQVPSPAAFRKAQGRIKL